jgi:hypothetical protein
VEHKIVEEPTPDISSSVINLAIAEKARYISSLLVLMTFSNLQDYKSKMIEYLRTDALPDWLQIYSDKNENYTIFCRDVGGSSIAYKTTFEVESNHATLMKFFALHDCLKVVPNVKKGIKHYNMYNTI